MFKTYVYTNCYYFHSLKTDYCQKYICGFPIPILDSKFKYAAAINTFKFTLVKFAGYIFYPHFKNLHENAIKPMIISNICG